MRRARIVIATALFGAFVFSFATLPAAADSFIGPMVTVKFGDLDVSHPQGAAVRSPSAHTTMLYRSRNSVSSNGWQPVSQNFN